MTDAKGKMYDAFADLDATGPGGRRGGRGENSGWLKCPLCPPSSKKRFAKGRGFAAHLRSIHAPDPKQCTHEEIKAWSKRAAQVVREAEQNCMEFAEGRTRTGKAATSYGDSLPEGLLAAKMGDLAKLRLLVREGWNPCAQLDRNGATAEHWAAGSGHLECLAYLHEWGERNSAQSDTRPKSARRRDGKTSLHWAARNGHMLCLAYLVDKRMEVDVGSGDGTTPLHLACFGGHLSACKYLVDKGADVARKNAWDCDATHWACMSTRDPQESVAICHWLRHDLDCSFHRPQSEGHTPAHKAAQRGNQAVLEWLLGPGCALTQEESRACMDVDHGGRTPRAIAQAMGHVNLSSWLASYEAAG
mmetsp:Transcript_10925/g.67494  ORF Transcript_10925/g.67494 Transcript_10925/m.67494 type:complete len:360 (-) Transcript_10925:43-1122(-)